MRSTLMLHEVSKITFDSYTPDNNNCLNLTIHYKGNDSGKTSLSLFGMDSKTASELFFENNRKAKTTKLEEHVAQLEKTLENIRKDFN